MAAWDPKTFAGDGLMEIYQRLHEQFDEVGWDNVPPVMLHGLASLRLAMLMMLEGAHMDALQIVAAGQEKIDTGDMMEKGGEVCWGAAILIRRRLASIPGKNQQARKLASELEAIAERLSDHGFAMMQGAEATVAGNA